MRLLEDMQVLAQQEGITALVVNMNAWKHDYEGFLDTIHQQLAKTPSKELAVVSTSNQAVVPASHLPQMLSLHRHQHPQIFLLLNNYDALLENKKQQFPKSFFDDLNSIKNSQTSKVQLCISTKVSHKQLLLYYKDQHGESLKTSLSPLDLDIIEIPRPTLEDIRREINKLLQEAHLWKQEPEKERFIDAIHDHTACYEFLKILKDSFMVHREALPAEIRLKNAYTQYGKHHHPKKEPLISWDRFKQEIEWFASIVGKIRVKKE